MTKKLYRSEDNRVIAGICGGIGEYFDVDPVVIRLFYILITVFTGLVPGIIAYLFAMLIVPERSHAERFHQTHQPETPE